MDEQNCNATAILEAGRQLGASARVETINGIPVFISPDGFRVAQLPDLAANPPRKRGTFNALDVPAFGRHFNTHKLTESVIVCDPGTESRLAVFVAIINYHGTLPSFGDFRTAYQPEFSSEWKRWLAANKKGMDHGAFLEFLEENQEQVIEPQGAALLELIKSLEGTAAAKFESALNLHNGSTRLSYVEDVKVRGNVDAATREGTLEVPATLGLGIAPFEFGQPYKLTARLRYRVQGKQLTFAYDIVEPHRIIADAVRGICDKIKELTGVEPMYGKAPEIAK